ncbi:MAG: DUF4870 domain-containing protein [Canibacter sp.]
MTTLPPNGAAGGPGEPGQPGQPGGPAGQQPYAQQPADPFSMVQLNYWLSVFFVWIPALIFYLVERGKNPQADLYHRENLNFALTRTAVIVAGSLLGFIPFLGALLAVLVWIASLVLFIFHIIAAAKLNDTYRGGQKPGFVFNLPFLK